MYPCLYALKHTFLFVTTAERNTVAFSMQQLCDPMPNATLLDVVSHFLTWKFKWSELANVL